MRPYGRVYATVDLDAVAANMKAMKDNLPEHTGMIGVVKADGYGHGAVPVALTVDPYVRGFAVAAPEEGMILRNHGIRKMILVLGVTHPDRYADLIRSEIRPAVFEMNQARRLSETACRMNCRAKIHLAVDTGMSRIGMRPDARSADMVTEISRLPGVEIEGMFTHFARADELDKTSASAQLAAFLRFDQMLLDRGIHIPMKHCSNSAGIVEGLPSNALDLVRAGISIYGLYPSCEVDRGTVRLLPALELKSCISYLKTIEPGTPVSYGGTFVAERRTRIATIPVGYGDGYPRSLSGKGEVLICGRRAPILGRVCMDQFMVDVTEIPEAEEDCQVTLIGRDGGEMITVEELAERSGGFHYELICNLGKRVPRVYLRGGRIVGRKDYFQDTYEDFRSRPVL